MKGFGRQRWVGSWVGVLGALLAGAGFAPSAAQASCGDYVLVGKHTPEATTNHSLPARHGALPTTPQPLSHPTGGRMPCSGPECSGGPAVPPLAPAPDAPQGSEQWGDCGTFSPGTPLLSFAYLTESDSLRPVHRPSALYHPPRHTPAPTSR